MKYLIIGNCAAGIHALEAIREVDKTGRVTVVSDEPFPAYCRCLISYYLAGTRTEADLEMRPKGHYNLMNVNTILGKRAVKIDFKNRMVILDDDRRLDFDKLLIATGASAKPLGAEGENLKGCFKFRTIEDTRNIIEMCKETKDAVVLGGGLIGLKAAYGLKKRGLNVKIIIKSGQVMSQIVDKGGAEIIKRQFEKNGVEILTGLAAKKIFGNGKVHGAELDNGQSVKCEIIIIGKGVDSNLDLVKNTEIKTHWGILSNNKMETNIKDIFAAGDVAETIDLATGEPTINALWSAAAEQGRIAGFNMAGKPRIYEGSCAENAVEFFGLPVISLGIHRPQGEGFQEVISNQPEKFRYKKLVFKQNRLAGVVIVGDFKNAGVFLSLIKSKADVSGIKDILMEDSFDYSKMKDIIPKKKEGVLITTTIDAKEIFG